MTPSGKQTNMSSSINVRHGDSSVRTFTLRTFAFIANLLYKIAMPLAKPVTTRGIGLG